MNTPGISIYAPNNFHEERIYSIHAVFTQIIGIKYQLHFHEKNYWRLSAHNSHIDLPDIFFTEAKKNWLKPKSCPQIFKYISQSDEVDFLIHPENELPLISYSAGKNKIISQKNNGLQLDLDVFGSTFFFLTRYEEIIAREKEDELGRFPASQTLAFQHNFLERPLVNEYCEILWKCIKKIWPDIKRQLKNFKVSITHDIDTPFNKNQSIALNEGIWKPDSPPWNPSENTKYVNWAKTHKDQVDTYNFLMEASEAINEKSDFYFIFGPCPIDPRYDIKAPKMLNLIRKIHKRGHRIGLHPTKSAHLNFEKLKSELENMLQIFQKIGIHQKQIGGRHHFLRFRAPDTWSLWDKLGINYDSTLGFFETAGFRASCCSEFQPFDIYSKKMLSLIERPLNVMECALTSSLRLGLNEQQAIEKVKTIIDACYLYSGRFTLLWHNTTLVSPEQKDLYKKIIFYLKSKLRQEHHDCCYSRQK